MAESEASEVAADPLHSEFVKQLVKVWRAQDTHGAWEGKNDAMLLDAYILTPERKKELPIMGDPDPETLWRLELFYNAIGLSIERATGVMVSPLMKLHHEGFGRLVLTAGRLIVVNKQLRDTHRFGFANMEKLAAEGQKAVMAGIEMIERYPEVASFSEEPKRCPTSMKSRPG